MRSEADTAGVISVGEAAQLLGVPHEFFIDLVKRGQIPNHLVGTDCRVMLTDVIAYRRERDRRRQEALNQMAKDALHAGHYDEF